MFFFHSSFFFPPLKMPPVAFSYKALAAGFHFGLYEVFIPYLFRSPLFLSDFFLDFVFFVGDGLFWLGLVWFSAWFIFSGVFFSPLFPVNHNLCYFSTMHCSFYFQPKFGPQHGRKISETVTSEHPGLHDLTFASELLSYPTASLKVLRG